MNKIFIAIAVFLVIGGYAITSNNDYNLKDNNDDRKSFVKDFSGWVVNIGGNIKDLTGQAQRQDWLPEDKNATDTVK
tara:strand:+ start:328 stop:558 length:231 start_codon:yes stop_codon:yes gene_type:complete